MFISIEQIKAARALLSWTQKELASHADLHDDQVHSFESGRTRSLEVLEAIHAAFEKNGITFADGGVLKKKHEVKVLNGRQGFAAFYDDIYETIKEHGGRILISDVIEETFKKWLGDKREPHGERMAKLKNFTQKIIVREDTNNIMPFYSTTAYRMLPAEQLSGVPFYLYGTKLAIINFEPEDVNIFIIDQPNIAQAYEKTFFTLWNMGREVGKAA